MSRQATQSLWRRLLRRHAFSLYRYADNLLRIHPKALAWRVYNRMLWPQWSAITRKTRPRRQPTRRQWVKALGPMPPEKLAEEWLSGNTTTPFYTNGADLGRLCDLARKNDPEGVRETLGLADACLEGNYRLLEAKPTVKISTPFDWQANPLGDIEWPHALNRFRRYSRCLSRAYRYTGREEYAELLVGIIEDWIEHNPEDTPISWLSMETSLRLIEWCWALHFLCGSAALTGPRLMGIWGSMMLQARCLARHGEFELSDNHLIYNLGSLCILARSFPFLISSHDAKWARREFLHQLRRQHRRDGMNVEQSTHYFVQVARIYAETLCLDEPDAFGHDEMRSFVGLFSENIAAFLRPDGTLPLLGDAFTSFFERSASVDAHVLLAWAAATFGRGDYKHIVGALPESAVFLLGKKAEDFEAIPPRQPSETAHAMPDSGYFIARSDWTPRASYLCAHAGPLGFPPVPAHGHPDLLGFEWCHHGRAVVTDPGTFEYEPGEWAYYFRRTRAHATVTVDGADQSTQWGFTRWVDLPDCRILAQGAEGTTFWLEAEHNGYTRLEGDVMHRRRLAWLISDVLVIEDLLTGQGEHLIQQTFPLAATVSCQLDTDLRAANISTEDAKIILKPLVFPGNWTCRCVKGQEQPTIWGFSAANYGVCDPAFVVSVESRCTMPARCLTILAAVKSVQQTGPLEWELQTSDGERIRLGAEPAGGFRVTASRDGVAIYSLSAGCPNAVETLDGSRTETSWRYVDLRKP